MIDHITFINEWTVPFIVIVWIIGVHYFFDRMRRGNDVGGNREDEERSDTLIIVEAPNEQQFLAVGAIYLESKTYFSSPPVSGKRIVLNSEEDGDDSTILGTIEEAAESVYYLTDKNTWWCAWVRLDKPEDYEQLYHKYKWRTGDGDRYRSTSPVFSEVTSYRAHTMKTDCK